MRLRKSFARSLPVLIQAGFDVIWFIINIASIQPRVLSGRISVTTDTLAEEQVSVTNYDYRCKETDNHIVILHEELKHSIFPVVIDKQINFCIKVELLYEGILTVTMLYQVFRLHFEQILYNHTDF